jgi:hypothetical protein
VSGLDEVVGMRDRVFDQRIRIDQRVVDDVADMPAVDRNRLDAADAD